MPSNEWDQYKVAAPAAGEDEWSQYRAAPAAPAPLSGPIGDKVPEPEGLQGKETYGDYIKSISTPQSGIDTIKGIAKSGAEGINNMADTSLLSAVPHSGETIPVNTEAEGTPQKVGKFVGNAIQTILPMAAGAEQLPSTARAGKVFQSVMQDAKDVPVDMAHSGDALLRLHELRRAGSLPPRAANQLLERVTAPGKPALTYKEGRDFYTGMGSPSVFDRLRTAPVVKREMTGVMNGMRQDIGNAAASVGRGEDYENAMKEFRNAKRIQKIGAGAGAAALGYGAKAAGIGAVLHTIKSMGGQ